MTDSNQYKKYETISLFIRPNVRQNIIDTYNKYIRGRKPERYIHENYIETTKLAEDSKAETGLNDIIAVCTYIALSKEGIEQAIRTYRENRRIYKRNWFNDIKNEMGPVEKMRPKNPHFLRNYAQSAKLINEMDRSMQDTQTIEEIMHKKYAEIDSWRTDTTAPISDFFFLSQKPVKTLANGFVNDITFESLIIIRREFGGSIEGFNVRYPTEFTKHPIFSFRNTLMDFEPVLIENELSFLNRYFYTDEDTEGEITVKFNPDGKKLPSLTTQKSVSKIIKDLQIDLKQRELDMKDREIMTQLFNMISGENITAPSIQVDLTEFTRRVLNIKVPKRKHYEDIGRRLEKLKNYDYTISVSNRENGKVIETTTLGLLNYLYINYEEKSFQYTPSEQWIRTYLQKKYINILSDSYTSIQSAQTKGIMMILQQERLSEYTRNSFAKTLPLKYFRLHMKLQRMGNAALLKELTNHLSILKGEKIVVKNFEVVNKNSALKIDFFPLDSRELVAYDFNPKQALEKEEIIDADYIEIAGEAGQK